MSDPVIELKGLKKDYGKRPRRVRRVVLRGTR